MGMDPVRAVWESTVIGDVQAMSAESDQIGRVFAGAHALSANDFRALVHIMVAENAGVPITYLVERMIESGHLRRESDPADRRKVILRYADHGVAVGQQFFAPLATHTHEALAELPVEDLAAAHRVITAVLGAMRDFRADLSSTAG